MKAVIPSILAILVLAAPQAASATPPGDDTAPQAEDPIEPAQPTGFERRDIEEMDRRLEERRDQWRVEEATKAKAKRQAEATERYAQPDNGVHR